MAELAYKRVLLKLSGEALAKTVQPADGSKKVDFGIDHQRLSEACSVIKRCVDAGAEIGVVVGAGNFWRGGRGDGLSIERTRADYMGMLATIMNSLAICDGLEKLGVDVRIQTSIDMLRIAEPFNRAEADRHLKAGRVVVFGGGTGSPFFSTDTGVVLKAVEMNADAVLMAKAVDGIYNKDPALYPDAVKYDKMTYSEMLEKNLKAIDITAAALAMENKLPMVAFALADPENIVRVLKGEHIGTTIYA